MKNLQSKLSIINSLIINKYYEKAKYICIDLIEKEPNFLPYRLGLEYCQFKLDKQKKLMNIVPNISVIIPSYNVEKYIDKCLWSVRNQTLKNIEIIVVDDGSTDKTPNIVEQHAQQDNRIIYIKNKISSGNSGTPRNQAIKIAKGEYLGFVDSDDWIENNMFEKLYEKTIVDKCDIISSIGFFNHNDDELEISITKISNKNTYNKILDYPAMWYKIFNRKFIINNNITFSTTPIGADLMFSFNSFVLAKSISIVEGIFYHYRRNRVASTNDRRKGKASYFIIDVCNDIMQFLIKNNILNKFSHIFIDKLLAGVSYNIKILELQYHDEFLARVSSFVKSILDDKKYTELMHSDILNHGNLKDLLRKLYCHST